MLFDKTAAQLKLRPIKYEYPVLSFEAGLAFLLFDGVGPWTGLAEIDSATR